MKKQKNKRLSMKAKVMLIILLVPITVVIFTLTAIIWIGSQNPELLRKSANTLLDLQERHSGTTIPEEYISIYKAASEAYGVPWTLLAAHHRIETRFSTMDPLLSPVGAEGHMQFMPCTFVGWSHPSCGGLGQGDIPEADKTNPEVIKRYGGYGVDANGDGIADPYDIEDAIFSTANYLARSGAADGDYEEAIFEYNRSEKYVQDVLGFFNEFEAYRIETEQ